MAKKKPTAKKLTTQARVAVSQTNISTRDVVLSERQQTTLQVDLKARPDFKGAIAAYVFDSAGNLTDQAPVRSGKVTLKTSAKTLSHPAGNSYYRRIIDRMLSSAKLTGKLRQDEAGTVFYWITTRKQAISEGKD